MSEADANHVTSRTSRQSHYPRTLAPLPPPPSTSRSSYATEIADSTALFDPKQSPIPSTNTETKYKLYEEDQTSDSSSIRTELTSCDTTSKLGKSERGAVRAMGEGVLMVNFPVSSPRCPFCQPEQSTAHQEDALQSGPS